MTEKITEQNDVVKVEFDDDLCIDSKNILEIMPAIIKLQNDKGKMYGRSWCKHGDVSAFFNVERKFDRIHNIMERALAEGVDKTLHSQDSATATETFLDTVVDLGVYAFMWAGYIRETHPEEWEAFLRNNEIEY